MTVNMYVQKVHITTAPYSHVNRARLDSTQPLKVLINVKSALQGLIMKNTAHQVIDNAILVMKDSTVQQTVPTYATIAKLGITARSAQQVLQSNTVKALFHTNSQNHIKEEQTRPISWLCKSRS